MNPEEAEFEESLFPPMEAADETSTSHLEGQDETETEQRRQSLANMTDFLRFGSVKDVTSLFRSNTLANLFRKLVEYGGQDAPTKNAITKEDPEYQFVTDCSGMALKLEVEKTVVHKFIADHYGVRFPELGLLVPEGYTYAKVVKVISNVMDLSQVIDEIDEVLPSQTSAGVIACASTTHGRDLTEAELYAVMEACDEMNGLEEAKQALLEYIQTRMPLIARNLSAFLGSGLTSQMFALAGSITALATMDTSVIMKLGSNRQSAGGFSVPQAGFLVNSDLVACHTPELRPKALRLVAQNVLNLARVDDNRRAPDAAQGLKSRDIVKKKMLQWTDPLVQRGRAHDTYERYTRKTKRSNMDNDDERMKRGINRYFKRV